jgi:D-inositol-3-phosphate glycosyltransferase
MAPRTWARGPLASERLIDGIPCIHVGAWWCELEMQRYRPRALLTQILDRADVIQIVAGAPAWGLLASESKSPTMLQVATMSRLERQSQTRSEFPGPISAWRRLMSAVTASLDVRGLQEVDRVMVENHRMYDFVAEMLSPDSVEYAPPGVDMDLFSPAPHRQACGPILTVGRLNDPRKNIRMLIEAYSKLRSRCEMVPELLLVGKDLRNTDYAAARELNVDRYIRVLPNASQEQLIQAYQEASIFVLSSDEEGFGLVVVEAMASGLPVVATRCGGPEAIVRHGQTGYLTDVGDVDEFTMAIGQLVKDQSLAATFGRNGRSIAVREYSQRERASQFLSAYRALTNADDGGSSGPDLR